MKAFATYVFLAIAISWIVWLPMYGHILGLSLPALSFQHECGAYGPFLAAVITTYMFRKKGLPAFIVGIFSLKRFHVILLAAAGPFIITCIALLINDSLLTESSALLKSKSFPGWAFGTVLAYNVFTFGLGEEVGWRGFALPYLQKRYGIVIATLLLTVIWGVWHIPLFIYRPGYSGMEMVGIIGWAASLLTGSVIFTWLYNAGKGSVMACVLFHACMDVVFMAPYKNENIVGTLGMLITILGIVIVIIYTIWHFKNRQAAIVNYITDEKGTPGNK